MVCDLCGKDGVQIRYVSETHGKGANILIIENIPMVSCPNCHGSYFTAKTLHEIEQIKGERQCRATLRTVAVAQFPSAA